MIDGSLTGTVLFLNSMVNYWKHFLKIKKLKASFLFEEGFITSGCHIWLAEVVVIAYLQFSIFIAQQVEFLSFSLKAAEEAANILETKLLHGPYAFFKLSFILVFVEKQNKKG